MGAFEIVIGIGIGMGVRLGWPNLALMETAHRLLMVVVWVPSL